MHSYRGLKGPTQGPGPWLWASLARKNLRVGGVFTWAVQHNEEAQDTIDQSEFVRGWSANEVIATAHVRVSRNRHGEEHSE